MTEATDASVGVSPERQAFLDAAFNEHIGAEMRAISWPSLKRLPTADI